MQIDKLIKEVSTDNLSGQQCAFSRACKRNNKRNWKSRSSSNSLYIDKTWHYNKMMGLLLVSI